MKGPEGRDEVLISKLALRVRSLRVQRRWSQENLAEMTGLHRNYIGHTERGDINVGLTNIGKLAQAFDLSIPEFMQL